MTSLIAPALRCAEPADATAIQTLVRAAYAQWVPLLGREPMPMTVDYEQALKAHRFDLLVDGACLLGVLETEIRDDHLWIENIAIHPDRQGHGLGRRLLALAETLADAAGCKEIRLLTNGAFKANIALYEKVGYVITGREAFMGGTTIYMTKTLPR